MTAEEEQDALQRMAKGDVEARADLIEHNLRLVAPIVKQFDIRRKQTEDLISIGTLGLIKGIDTFKVDKEHNLATYVTLCIVCYPLTDAFMVPNQYPQSRKEPRWRILAQVSENMYILCSALDGCVRYAPMYIHSFRPIAPRKILEAQLFNQQYQNYEDIPNVPDRLRWCRHHMGLMQKEVAELIGISRGHYIDFEVGYVDYYPKEIVDKLAELYGVPVDDLLDDYNRFLYKGQGKMIREYRESLGLKKKLFARLMGISPNLLRAWEDHQKRMNINSWNKYFKGKIKA